MRLKPDIISQSTDGHHTEERKEQLRTYLHTIRHTVVLDKGNIEPVGHPDTLMQLHVGLHPYLNELVNKEDGDDQYHRQSPFSHDFLSFIHFFCFSICFDSTLSVA